LLQRTLEFRTSVHSFLPLKHLATALCYLVFKIKQELVLNQYHDEAVNSVLL